MKVAVEIEYAACESRKTGDPIRRCDIWKHAVSRGDFGALGAVSGTKRSLKDPIREHATRVHNVDATCGTGHLTTFLRRLHRQQVLISEYKADKLELTVSPLGYPLSGIFV